MKRRETKKDVKRIERAWAKVEATTPRTLAEAQAHLDAYDEYRKVYDSASHQAQRVVTPF
ncbi:hypothetical protein [Streptosporangium saharense]|uniref:Uncharacterized protein n=1 Tax=Streptosporangium saharense TaxID=1706840 RepID=A0A7W7QW47_9ACTN|nr:hypothetical protein [Streptosporangium saharense]MBB4920887.1 hypothetical protein [Streptosporangium saharense]